MCRCLPVCLSRRQNAIRPPPNLLNSPNIPQHPHSNKQPPGARACPRPSSASCGTAPCPRAWDGTTPPRSPCWGCSTSAGSSRPTTREASEAFMRDEFSFGVCVTYNVGDGGTNGSKRMMKCRRRSRRNRRRPERCYWGLGCRPFNFPDFPFCEHINNDTI